MKFKFSTLAVSASLLLLCSVNTAALADGMPFKESKPQPILTPLDKALDDLDAAQETEQPVDVTPAAAAPVVQPPPPPVKAEVPPVPEARIVEVQPNASFFGLSVGMYDPFTHNEKAAAFNLEWQPGVKVAGFLQPIFGAMVTTSGSMLGYGGIGVPFNITDRVFMMPSIAVGAYKKGGGYDLERTLAFRVGTELAYQFDDKSRIGLNIHALTNGTSFDRSDRTEIIGLTFTKPFETFSGPATRSVPAETATPAPSLAPPSEDTTAAPVLQEKEPENTETINEIP